MAPPIITLTTDFGLRDYYVGAMKGVMLRILPEATLVDLSHEIAAQDVLEGAFVLEWAAREFPPGTTHLAVVDPGVGTRRRALALASGSHLWVGPDNGLLDFALARPDASVRQIEHPALKGPGSSHTFHGRDLFAPAAAHLAAGFPLEAVGPPVADPVRLPAVRPRRCGGGLAGEIIHVDHFGNLVSNIAADDLPALGPAPLIRLGGGPRLRGLCRTYADVPPGECLALIGSAGYVEVSIHGGSAARELGAGRRTPIYVEAAR